VKNILLILVSLFTFTDIFSGNYCKRPHKLPKKISLRSIEKSATKHNCPQLVRAAQATRELCAKYKHPGIKKRRFLQAALYIETHLPDIKNGKKHYITRKKTKIKNTVEYDPVTGHTFIILDSKKAFLGKGAKKNVYKSILYNQNPQVLARSEQSYPMEAELQAHQALHGAPGIMKTHAFTTHKHKKKEYRTIYSDLYQGTLMNVLNKNRLGIRNKLIIMRDLLVGLDSIHARGYVHRDLHAHNYLLRIQRDHNGKKTFHAVIADLGRTIQISQAKKVPAQMTRRLCPPEGFNPKKLKGNDYFATDIYALGSIFHRMYHNKIPRWQQEYLKSHTLSRGQKKAKLIAKLKKATESRRKSLLRKKDRKGSLSIKQDTELLILKMVHHNPAERGSAGQWRSEIQDILNRAGT
jgi:serine/threonine protein kinase